MRTNHFKYYILLRIARLMYIGFHKDNSEEVNVKIVFLNILNFSYIINQLIATLLYFFAGVYNSALYSLALMPAPFLVYYFNSKMQYLLGKVFIFIYYNTIILLTSCYFSHPYLSYYYIPAIIGSAIVFNTKEIWYLLGVNMLSVSFLIIENTSLRQYLPHFYQDRSYDKTTVIVLVVHINFVIGLLCMYAYYMHLKIKRLIQLNKTLKDTKIKLKSQKADYVLFSEASSNFLKSPIYIFNTFIGKIEQGIQDNKSYDEMKPYFSVIKKSIMEEEKFINNMFDYNKTIITLPQKTPVNLNLTINEALAIFRSKNKNFSFSVDECEIILKIDRELLRKIVLIIAENAFSYNTNVHKSLEVKCCINADSITVDFKDNGIGITENFRENIFKPYVRINSTEISKGIGIGLLKAKKMSELIDSQIILKESSPLGTTFQLIINTYHGKITNKNRIY
ncbi:MAG: HAMP domain-containing histidine kinase [Chryseobacterium sp.]|nr:MAG: HAMP domain-containing histidine kinase [Chryseobacterium sp.]